MSIYTYTQESFDSQNLQLSKLFDIEYVHIHLTDEERTVETVKHTRFTNPGFPGVGRKAAETKRRLGLPTGLTPEAAQRMVETKRKKYGSNTYHMQNLEARAKANSKCSELASRPIVEQLRQLAKIHQLKLGSGWVRKPDHWIQEKIDLIKDRILVP
jgi:hypothetical protein